MIEEVKIIIIGCGARGKETYGRYAMKNDSKMKIVAICDNDIKKLEEAKNEFKLNENQCFLDYNDIFKREKFADVMIISNYDQEHFDVTIKAINAKYGILLEKPISNNLQECLKIRDEANKNNVNITVCHVMRYTSYYMYLKELLSNGTIGDIIALEQTEDVGYWHMAHAFVRGNFRNSMTTSPMILQKCCHDFDLIVYLLNANKKKSLRPVALSSFGDLRYFKKENAPIDSTDRCINCPVKDCIFNAVDFYTRIYQNRIDSEIDPNSWPLTQVTLNPTKDKLVDSLKDSGFGRCVFKCDNNVVDHQFTTIKFEDGTIATLTMIGFSNDGGRQTHVYGTKGEIYLDEQRRSIEISLFGHKKRIVSFDELSDDFSGHGGGDNEMLHEFVDFELNKNNDMLSSISTSVDSHILAFAAEESRIHKGKVININRFEERTKK